VSGGVVDARPRRTPTPRNPRPANHAGTAWGVPGHARARAWTAAKRRV